MRSIFDSALRNVVLAWACVVSSCIPAFGQQPSVTRAGIQVPLYKASFALVIGASQYKTWPTLPNVLKDAEQVAAALEKQGFQVRRVSNPTGDTLQRAFRDFFADYGNDPDHRLLVFFAGHGHSIGKSGFLVPVDAPDPDTEPSLFMKRAQSMSQLASASLEYRARHALYVFDSCFSGAIFSTRSNPSAPSGLEDISRYLTGPAAQPVRQFITAGSESQRVPEISQFTPLFIRAIEGGVPELNRNGFVSGKDLGLWLTRNLSTYVSNQTPRSGTILNANFDQGDLIFGFQSSFTPATRAERAPEPTPSATRSAPEKNAIKPSAPAPSSASCFIFNGKTFCE
ncbi:MAG: caspase family protein [Ramlibacter sp.]